MMDGWNERVLTRVKNMKSNTKLSNEVWDIISEQQGEGLPRTDEMTKVIWERNVLWMRNVSTMQTPQNDSLCARLHSSVVGHWMYR